MKPGQPAYELARALWIMSGWSVHIFDSMDAAALVLQVDNAEKIIAQLDQRGFTITTWDDIDGG